MALSCIPPSPQFNASLMQEMESIALRLDQANPSVTGASADTAMAPSASRTPRSSSLKVSTKPRASLLPSVEDSLDSALPLELKMLHVRQLAESARGEFNGKVEACTGPDEVHGLVVE